MSDLGRLSIEQRDHVVLARVSGELDLSNWEHVRAALESAVNSDDAGLVLDLGSTTYFDSAGVRLVFQLADRLRARRQELALVFGDNQIVERVAQLTSIGDHVACHTTVAAALNSLASQT